MQRIVVEAWRGTAVESRHEVWCAGAGTAGTAPGFPVVFLRSAVKPFQLVPLVALGGAGRFALEPADLAILAGSHDGTDAHASRVAAVLARMGLGEPALQCGAHRPYFLERLPPESPERLRVFGSLHDNCSGNHAAMLGTALLAGQPPGEYLDPAGPAQRRIHDLVHALAGTEPLLTLDDCASPCYGLPLGSIAGLYRFLADPAAVHTLPAPRRAAFEPLGGAAAVEGALGRISGAFAAHPEWVTGETTPYTRLVRAFPDGHLAVKHGAEGVLCVAHRMRRETIVLKVADGSPRALLPAFVHAAERAGWIDAALREALADLAAPALVGRTGQVVGKLRTADA